MSPSSFIDNKKDILILDKGPTQALEHSLAAEIMYSINLTKEKTKFCLSLHYNGPNSYLFVNGTEIIKFQALKFHTLVIMIYCYRNLDLAVTMAKIVQNILETTISYHYIFGPVSGYLTRSIVLLKPNSLI